MAIAAMVMKESGGVSGLFEEKEELERKRGKDGRLQDGAGLPEWRQLLMSAAYFVWKPAEYLS